MARGWKFRIYVVEGLYYPCSENEGADQIRGYREADLRTCFQSHMQKAGFLTTRLKWKVCVLYMHVWLLVGKTMWSARLGNRPKAELPFMFILLYRPL